MVALRDMYFFPSDCCNVARNAGDPLRHCNSPRLSLERLRQQRDTQICRFRVQFHVENKPSSGLHPKKVLVVTPTQTARVRDVAESRVFVEDEIFLGFRPTTSAYTLGPIRGGDLRSLEPFPDLFPKPRIPRIEFVFGEIICEFIAKDGVRSRPLVYFIRQNSFYILLGDVWLLR